MKEQLIAFTERVKNAFLAKQIKAPVHLCGGNEDELIEIFKDVRQGDWVFSNWRSAYHALLKGIPEEWVFNEILAGRSMYLMNAEHRFLCSSIVGGILPIACGVAMAIKRKGGDEKVYCFIGDMTGFTGICDEFYKYCAGHKLPVKLIVEDNGYSTNTPTLEAWGNLEDMSARELNENVHYYHYQRRWPHVGVGTHVSF